MSGEAQKKTGISWPALFMALLLPGIGTVGTWFVMQYRVNAQEEVINKLDVRGAANQSAITTLQANVTEVKNDVSDIKDDVKDIQVEQVAQGKLLERILVEVSDGPSRSRGIQ